MRQELVRLQVEWMPGMRAVIHVGAHFIPHPHEQTA
jgi:hypothetical protein